MVYGVGVALFCIDTLAFMCSPNMFHAYKFIFAVLKPVMLDDTEPKTGAGGL